jgi:hypothetical protein
LILIARLGFVKRKNALTVINLLRSILHKLKIDAMVFIAMIIHNVGQVDAIKIIANNSAVQN